MATYSVEELSEFLMSKELDDDIVETLSRNKIGGKEFIALTGDLLREMFPIIGERLKVKELIGGLSGRPDKAQAEVSELISGYSY